MKILSVDIGGTHVKILLSGGSEKRKAVSGPTMTAEEMVKKVKELAEGWDYDVVSMGYPVPVADGKPVVDPANLGSGWINFDFAKAFGRPVKVINDAASIAILRPRSHASIHSCAIAASSRICRRSDNVGGSRRVEETSERGGAEAAVSFWG